MHEPTYHEDTMLYAWQYHETEIEPRVRLAREMTGVLNDLVINFDAITHSQRHYTDIQHRITSVNNDAHKQLIQFREDNK